MLVSLLWYTRKIGFSLEDISCLASYQKIRRLEALEGTIFVKDKALRYLGRLPAGLHPSSLSLIVPICLYYLLFHRYVRKIIINNPFILFNRRLTFQTLLQKMLPLFFKSFTNCIYAVNCNVITHGELLTTHAYFFTIYDGMQCRCCHNRLFEQVQKLQP